MDAAEKPEQDSSSKENVESSSGRGSERPLLYGRFPFWHQTSKAKGVPVHRGLSYWLPIAAAAVGGAAIGSYFLLASVIVYGSGQLPYSAGLFITGTLLVLSPPIVVWLLSRWTQEWTGEDRSGQNGDG